MERAEVVIVGAGASGLSLALALAEHAPGAAPVVVLDAADAGLRPVDRTWCWWEAAHGPYDDMLAASWDRLRLVGADGEVVPLRLPESRYKMLRSPVFEAGARERLAHAAGTRLVPGTVVGIVPRPDGSLVRARDARDREFTVRARWVFDSRPVSPLPPARTLLWQHFRGWFLRTAAPVFTPGAVDLMDFRTPQPARGLSFCYVLPLGPREALVEYTEFSRQRLTRAAYERELRRYVREVLGVDAYEVTGSEQGAIPMTDAVFARRAGPGVFRIGTAGGATRPATGYTFAAVQRQARAVAERLARGAEPVPPPSYGRRARAMDAVLLRALDRGRVRGPEFFTGLFGGVPVERVLRFLDGRTTWAEDLGIGLRVPVGAMTATALELPFVRRRPGG
ncbi:MULTISPECIES: lycopene cyclase family protein [unclassified Streptomyces]|uniref:lycopene cyclase family protein n=1 Tax=unclassified Streptomyces TaxID=2593676 RepID=UPI001012AC5C|nr:MULTISPECIES: lycopene cyclase family protein [unclassified Streptomyces]WEH31456.1 lycopene cyclase family protein [Streptomyces sp. AM 3-1-1]